MFDFFTQNPILTGQPDQTLKISPGAWRTRWSFGAGRGHSIVKEVWDSYGPESGNLEGPPRQRSPLWSHQPQTSWTDSMVDNPGFGRSYINFIPCWLRSRQQLLGEHTILAMTYLFVRNISSDCKKVCEVYIKRCMSVCGLLQELHIPSRQKEESFLQQ